MLYACHLLSEGEFEKVKNTHYPKTLKGFKNAGFIIIYQSSFFVICKIVGQSYLFIEGED